MTKELREEIEVLEDDFEYDEDVFDEYDEEDEDDAFDYGDLVTVRFHTQDEKDHYPIMGWFDEMTEMEGKTFPVDECEYNQVFLKYNGATFCFDASSVMLAE